MKKFLFFNCIAIMFFSACANSITQDKLQGEIFSSLTNLQVQRSEISDADAKLICKDNLDVNLLRQASSINAARYEFVLRNKSYKSNVSQIIISYAHDSDAVLAKKVADEIAYLKNTVILAPVYFKVDKNKIFILYTESAGDPEILDFIKKYTP